MHQMIHAAKPRTIKWWSESKLANGKPVVLIKQENTHLIALEWTEDNEAKLMTLA
jgi:hypothetical protein